MSVACAYLATPFVDWETNARIVLALFRANGARHSMTHGLRSWIHALEQASPEFRARWPQHDAGREPAQYKELNQPIVGRLVLEQIPFQAEDAPELTFLLYTPKAGTDTEAKLRSTSQQHNT